jgi:hypothetical protein
MYLPAMEEPPGSMKDYKFDLCFESLRPQIVKFKDCEREVCNYNIIRQLQIFELN